MNNRALPESARFVVLAVPDYEPTLGGTTTQVRLLGRALQARGALPVIVTRHRTATWAASEVRDGLPVIRLGPMGRSRMSEKANILTLAAWLARRRRQVAVVHSNMWIDAVAAAVAAGLGNRTVLTWAANGDATDAVAGWRGKPRRALLRRTRHVALTDAMAHEIEAVGLGAADVIPIAIDRAHFRPPSQSERTLARAQLDLSDDAFVVVYVGHLRQLKRVDHLVRAFAELAREHNRARLLLVGGSRNAFDDSELAVRKLVSELGLESVVTFTGVLHDPLPAYFAADVAVLASEREGMPNMLAEAMACGIACVAPASAGGAAMLGDDAGLVPPSNEPHDLLAALRRLADSPDIRAQIGAVAATRAIAFDPDAVAAQYEAVYRSRDSL